MKRHKYLWALRRIGPNYEVIDDNGHVLRFRNMDDAILYARSHGVDLGLEDGRIIQTVDGRVLTLLSHNRLYPLKAEDQDAAEEQTLDRQPGCGTCALFFSRRPGQGTPEVCKSCIEVDPTEPEACKAAKYRNWEPV